MNRFIENVREARNYNKQYTIVGKSIFLEWNTEFYCQYTERRVPVEVFGIANVICSYIFSLLKL